MPQKQSNRDQRKQNTKGDNPNRESIGERIEEEAEEVVEEARQGIAAARRPWYQTVKWGRILIAVYAILFVLFGLLAWWVFYHPVLAIDVTITREFQENQSPWLRYTMIAISFIGNVSLLSLGLIILVTVLLWIIDLRLEAVLVAAVSAVNSILNGLIKYIVGRPRPTSNLVDVIQQAGGQSFPSGHVMAYVAFWGLLFSFGIILFKGNHWWRSALLIVSEKYKDKTFS